MAILSRCSIWLSWCYRDGLKKIVIVSVFLSSRLTLVWSGHDDIIAMSIIAIMISSWYFLYSRYIFVKPCDWAKSVLQWYVEIIAMLRLAITIASWCHRWYCDSTMMRSHFSARKNFPTKKKQNRSQVLRPNGMRHFHESNILLSRCYCEAERSRIQSR